MFAALKHLLTRWFTRDASPEASQPASEMAQDLEALDSHLVPYDETLLEKSRTQWQFGDWESLAGLERETLQHHPDRAELILLAAAGRLQNGENAEARQYVRLAQDWGVSTRLISQILVAGVHNSLGRVAVVAGEESRALWHFESAIVVGTPGADRRLLTQARANEQIAHIGLPGSQTGNLISGVVLRRYALTAALAGKVKECMRSPDIHDAIDSVVSSKQLSPHELILFYIAISDQFVSLNDKVTALHFLQTARDQPSGHDTALNKLLIQNFITIGRPDIAADIAFQSSLETDKLQLSEQERKAIQTTYDKNRQATQSNAQHGHGLLISYIQTHLKEIKFPPDRKPVLIEIGTTRENLPEQGSTRKIAEFCRDHHLHFITVDMDPHNTRVAANLFSEMKVPFEAITMKGEEYLKEFTGTFDFIFLDAYDFDHGGHSSLRQSRYIKFLGNPIDEIACHQMHLDCAKSVITKLSPFGVVCFDDTWLVDGKWTAKGTTAMPYLLANGFHLLEARNNAALLTREKLRHDT